MEKIKVGIIGPGNIGQDLLVKIGRSELLEVACIVSAIESDNIKRVRAQGYDASSEGIDYMIDKYKDEIKIVFDCTSAAGHMSHAPKLKEAGMYAIDLTPAAVGPYCVPAINLNEGFLNKENVNLVTCAGQATAPMVEAINAVADVSYAEIVSSISSKSAGPGTRANIDEFTVTTKKALETVGGADKAKVIIILNPAEPPILMRNTIYTKVKNPDMDTIRKAAFDCLERVQKYVPGYRFLLEPIIQDDIVTMMVEVEGLGDYLPVYSGNLDIINAAALHIAEEKAKLLMGGAK
ncbi:MAG: acetaldehyde dehydrogenase (acetylating) [Eubacteriales bacterium]|nr:acetaldehyde dehydrogenase (acetylating) [Eubacteriales bacterium]MDD4390625.1 acetaldehyde dehydrogenase (acetylating) [Eubacteriales bacterium]